MTLRKKVSEFWTPIYQEIKPEGKYDFCFSPRLTGHWRVLAAANLHSMQYPNCQIGDTDDQICT